MKHWLLFGVVPGLVLFLACVVVTERFVRRILRPWLRKAVRAVCALAACSVSLGAVPYSMAPLSRGTWSCPVCGALEERTSYLGVTIESEEPSARDIASAMRYSDWLATTGPVAHEHGWIPTGCHWSGSGTVSCSAFRANDLFHESLPLAPDPELARGLVLRLARVPTSEQRELLLDFRRERPDASKGLFYRIARHEPLTSAQFAAELDRWLGQHPLWR